ncbi:YitT family protein [Lactobacillus sp. ESL0791]|uniref:YitT family protein n=1 Tax=Lactobacillus sp. ESL0791 TaxID=2983234 RepID=UPI0023F8B9C5|nr:YitT family protein [Lactobacillus sp. ESL0791]MDF7638699.1 YitT family protein [Lactobacillus sp. ESL0791]
MTTIKKPFPWKRGLILLAGLEIVALAVNFFYAPLNTAVGGSTGISILVDAVWGINRSVTVFIINLLMLILAFIFLGKKKVCNIVVGSMLLPVLMQITPSFKVIDNDLLAMIYGGALMGFGVSLLYRVNASSGGTTVPPLILQKYLYIDSATSLFIIDMAIIFLNVFVDGWNAFFLAAFSQVITTLTMRYTETGFNKKYQVRVMSNRKIDEIRAMLQEEYQGLTIYDVTGGYSDKDKQLLWVVVDPNEYGRLVSHVQDIDADAFIITESVAKVHGGRWRI